MLISGSLASKDMISEADLLYGRMPENEHEIVIDKMVYDRAESIKMIGLYEASRMLNSKVYVGNELIEYTIVGISNLESPSIYVYNSQFINIIDNSNSEYESGDNNGTVYDYELYKNNIKIVKGNVPSNDYEVIINNDLRDEYKINKYLDNVKVNGNKLKVVGYYTSSDNSNNYYVNSNTNKYELINSNKKFIIYSDNKEKAINEFKDIDRKLIDVYDSDREDYIEENTESIRSSMIVAGIMLGISLIEIILMTRSSFLSRIKEVGIYRAIGVKKSDIYMMFIGEAFAITTLSSVPGVLFMAYCINVISDVSFVSNNYVMNIYVIGLCLLILYVFNIVVSLIPVFNTLRKTPAEILSKHEVD